MRNKLYSVLLTAVAACMLFGCAPQQEAPVINKYREFVSGQVLTGGTAAENVNLSQIRAERQGDVLNLSFEFIEGSRMSGGTQEGELYAVPQYAVCQLVSPSRIAVELDQLSYWDYERVMELDDELIYGCFRENLFGSPGATIYFQLSDDVNYKVQEKGSTLTISIVSAAKVLEEAKYTPAPEEYTARVQYFAATNAYAQYCAGTITREYDVTPVLSRNFNDVVLMSPAFDTQQEAERFKSLAVEASGDLLAEQWDIIALYHNDLPIYNEELDSRLAYSRNVIRRGGAEQTLDVLLPDGIYLCTAPNGTILFSKRIRDNSTNEEDAREYEQLWTADSNASKQLLRFEFAAIESCLFSPDGQKLAVLESADEGAHLYIFDTNTYELLVDLSEVGFGGMVSAFTWDSLGSTIFAVSGSSTMQVNQYDFSIPDETKRHAVVDKDGVDEGSVAVFEGEVLFTESDMEKGAQIYRIKPDGGVRRAFLSGGAFKLSPDSRYLAYSPSGSALMTTGAAEGLALYDLATGESSAITDEFAVYDFVWNCDSSKLFFFENRLSGGENEGLIEGTAEGEQAADDAATAPTEPETPVVEDEYPYTLYCYDVASKTVEKLDDMKKPSLLPSNTPNILYIPFYDDSFGGSRSSYIYDVEAAK